MQCTEYSISEIASLKYGKMLSKDKMVPSGYPVYSGYRVTGYAPEYMYEEPMLVVVARGVGGTGNVRISPPKSWITNLSIVLDVNDEKVDKNYLCMYLGLERLKEQLDTGAAQSQITIASLEPYRVRLPSLAAQRRIASILSTYDDLIENNTRRIAVLEEMARRLYEEWFVHFRFPGHEDATFTETEHGRVPKGWEIKCLGDLVDDVRDSVHPSKVDSATPYVGLEHIPRRSTTLAHWSSAEIVNSNKLQFRRGDILFGKIRPYFHKVVVAPIDGICSSDTILLRPKTYAYAGLALLCASSDQFVDHAIQTSNGTKMPRANWNVLKDYPITLPPAALLQIFNDLVQAGIEQNRILMLKNGNLRIQRDLLLPKLVSGEIDVSEAEETTKDAVA